MIEKAALGDPIDECADEAKVLHRSHQLRSAGVGALHRQHGKAREAGRIAGDGRRQMVVHLARDGDAVRARHEVGTRTGVGEHLHRDAGLVHGLQASLADLGQHVERVGAMRRRCARPEAAPADGAGVDAAHQRGDGEMLFKRDNTHGCVGLSLPLDLLS